MVQTILSQFYSMDEHSKLNRIKECFNESQLFSTQVSSEKDSSAASKHLFRISSKFTDDPQVYYKKVRDRCREAGKKHEIALRNNLRAKSQLSQVQKDAEICRQEFLKMYQNKKFKLQEKSKLEDHQLDMSSVQKFKRKKILEDLSISLRREDKERYREELVQKRKREEKKFRETFRSSDERIRQRVIDSHEKITKERETFYQRKKNLMELGSTKSKFNYLMKINQQMILIKDYQDRLQEMQDDPNPESESWPESILPNIFASTYTKRMH